MKTILCIDGGGIRGLAPAIICKKIEETIGSKLSSKFDLIAGTSTGGIIALALANEIELDKIIQLYQNNGKEIFEEPNGFFKKKIKPKYSNEGLSSLLGNTFNSARLSDCETKVLVTSYDLERRSPFIIKNWDITTGSSEDYSLKSAALATSAAPTYFPPHLTDDKRASIDGGIYCNNPALLAYSKAKELWKGEKIKILSIGTGTLDTSIMYKDALKWGELQWIRPLIDCVFSGVAISTDEILGSLAKSDPSQLSYERIQFSLDKTCEDLDDVDSKSLANLHRIATESFKSKKDVIEKFLEVKKTPTIDKKLDDKSKYRRLRTTALVLQTLDSDKFSTEGIVINKGFTIEDLKWRCYLQNGLQMEEYKISEFVEEARASAFTAKYAEPTEDEKLQSPEVIQKLNISSWEDYIEKLLKDSEIQINCSDVIDVGTGNGQAYKTFYSSVQSLHLIDISEQALSYSKRTFPNAKISVASAENLTSVDSKSKDVYFSFRTYQSSLFDIKQALQEAYRVLRRDGVFVISIPIMFPREDGTITRGLLRSGESKPDINFAYEIASEIQKQARILGFNELSCNEESPYELYLIGHK